MPRVEVGRLDSRYLSPRLDNGEDGADRMFIGGTSGSGKSYLAKSLAAGYGYAEDIPEEFRGWLVICDPNENFRFPANRIVTNPEAIDPGPRVPVTRYVPGPDEQDTEGWNHFWRKVFYAEGAGMVVIDEVYAMEPLFNVRRLPGGGNMMTQYLTRGRARKKGAILLAQRPAWIPGNIIGQSNYFAMFDMPHAQDRKTMAGVMGEESMDGEDISERFILDKHEFWFSGPGMKQPMKMVVV